MLRYFNVFGPRQSPFSQYAAVVPLFLTAIARGEPITIDGDGEQSRDFTYVANVVDATMRAADARGANGRIFNVAAGAPATVNEVADAIGAILGKPVERRYGPPRAGDIRDSWADVDRGARDARLGADGRARGRPPAHRRRALAEPIRVLRVIARLNMGGPALHVAYLTEGLAERGYETTLVAGELARGEELDVVRGRASSASQVVTVPQLHREISPLRDAQSATVRLVRLIRRERPHILHTHTAKAGAVGRRRRAARRADGAAADRRAHLPRARAARLLRPAPRGASSGSSSAARARRRRARRRQPGGARRPRRARRRAAREVRGRPARDRARQPASTDGDDRERRPRGCSASRRTASSSAGSAA